MGVKRELRDKQEIEELSMGLFLGVARGSSEEPRLVKLSVKRVKSLQAEAKAFEADYKGKLDGLAKSGRLYEAIAAYHDGVREVRLVVRTPDGRIVGDLARDSQAGAASPPPLDAGVSLPVDSGVRPWYASAP